MVRNNLEPLIRPDITEKLAYVDEEPFMNLDCPPTDVFGPISEPTGQYFQLPESCSVKFIGEGSEIDLIRSLLEMEVIGVDCEWRPALHKFDITGGVATMQIGNKEEVFVIDMLKMNLIPEFDELMTEVFSTKKIVGMSFSSDLSALS